MSSPDTVNHAELDDLAEQLKMGILPSGAYHHYRRPVPPVEAARFHSIAEALHEEEPLPEGVTGPEMDVFDRVVRRPDGVLMDTVTNTAIVFDRLVHQNEGDFNDDTIFDGVPYDAVRLRIDVGVVYEDARLEERGWGDGDEPDFPDGPAELMPRMTQVFVADMDGVVPPGYPDEGERVAVYRQVRGNFDTGMYIAASPRLKKLFG